MSKEESEVPVGRFVAGGHYDKTFIAVIVSEVLSGIPKQVIQKKYGLRRSTLNGWLKKGDLAVESRRIGPNSTMDFKRTVVRSIESGRLSIGEAQRTYGIKTPQTIERWRKQIAQENADLGLSNEALMKNKKPTGKPASANTTDIEFLQKSLEEAQLKIAALNTLIDVAEDQLKINIRKKPGAKQSSD